MPCQALGEKFVVLQTPLGATSTGSLFRKELSLERRCARQWPKEMNESMNELYGHVPHHISYEQVCWKPNICLLMEQKQLLRTLWQLTKSEAFIRIFQSSVHCFPTYLKTLEAVPLYLSKFFAVICRYCSTFYIFSNLEEQNIMRSIHFTFLLLFEFEFYYHQKSNLVHNIFFILIFVIKRCNFYFIKYY